MSENLKYNDATPLRPEGPHTLDAPLVSIDLPAFLEQIKQEETWHNSDRNALTVFKTNGMRIVLVALHAGTKIKEHLADGIISVQVLEGIIQFKANDQCINLAQGQMVALQKGITHSVLAKEESVFLLTLTTTSAK